MISSSPIDIVIVILVVVVIMMTSSSSWVKWKGEEGVVVSGGKGWKGKEDLSVEVKEQQQQQ